MKPSDVTDDMLDAAEGNKTFAPTKRRAKEVIAASINAVFGDKTPISAEWLLANQWSHNESYSNAFYHKDDRRFCVWFSNDGAVNVACGDYTVYVKSVGQLRALEYGLGFSRYNDEGRKDGK